MACQSTYRLSRPGPPTPCNPWRSMGLETAVAHCPPQDPSDRPLGSVNGTGDFTASRVPVSTDNRISPQTDRKPPHPRPPEFPVGGQESSPGVRAQTSGFTPFPAVASAKRSDPPSVMTMWAWWTKRSTAAVARVFGMMVSNPAGWRLLVRATLRFS